MTPAAKICVVDDEPGMRHAVVRLMQSAGFAVIEAGNGKDALQQIRKERPDLVLLDVRLPDIDGLEVLKQIKADSAISNTFVVHLTAQQASPEATKEGLRRGADGYIVQPIDSGELIARVNAFLRHKFTMDELKASEARYRDLFEKSPQPMWIYDPQSHRFLMVNGAALAHYGFGADEFERMTLDDVVINGSRPRELSAGASPSYEEQHRTKAGRTIDVLVTEHEVSWSHHPGIATLILDVTARKQAERDREELIERYRREVRAFEEMTSNQRVSGLVSQGEVALQERLPAVFESGVSSYGTILNDALEERIYKVDHGVSARLNALACRLASARATPRDVVQIHYTALKERVPEPGARRAQGFIEAGRVTIVEIMGYLAACYREAAPVSIAR